MSEENVEIVRSTFAAFEKGDLTGGLEWAADDLITHRVEPDNAIYHGKEGFLQATADWIEDFEEWTVTPKEFIDGGDSVLVRVHQTARGEKSGVPVESNIWFAFEMRRRKIARLSFHLREAEALEAAGLSK
jgi:ketosteroid isomerase-like protein